MLETIANKDLKNILNNYFKKNNRNNINKKNISQKMQINQIDFKNDLRSKFSAALIIFYIENPGKRENTFDMIASAKFKGRFREIRDEIIKKTLFISSIYNRR